MDMLSADDIRALVQAGESQTIEFKLDKENQPDIGELLASFANADGGIALFGVTDAGQVVGVERVNVVRSRVIAAARSCRPPLTAYVSTYPVAVDGKQVLVVQLPAPGDQIYSYAGVYRRREGAANAVLSAEDMRYLILRRMSQDFDSHPLDLDLDVLDPVAVDRLLALRSELIQLRGGEPLAATAPYPSAQSLEQLVALHALTLVRGSYRPTVAGLLMLGHHPQRALPQAVVRLAAFADAGATTFLDRTELGGPIPEQLNRTLAFVGRNIRLGAYIAGAERIEQPQYPLVAVREAVVNALIHRSYSDPSPVLINPFPERLEILSPGGLLPTLKTQNLEGKHLLRNHALGPLAYFTRLAETWGTGIRRMRAALQELGLPAPEFLDEGSWLRLTFYSREAPAMAPVRANQAPRGSTLPSREPVRAAGGLNERQRELLAGWEQAGGGQIRRAEYQLRYNIAVPTAAKDLHALVQLGLVRQVGRGPSTVYIFVPQPHSTKATADNTSRASSEIEDRR
jgi:ATP-dependent DNA helicase RecG